MKNFVSFRIEPYSKGEAKNLIDHSHDPKARAKSTNIQFPQYTKYNLDSGNDVLSKFNKITNEIEQIKGKKIQKNANHYLEGVLAFSFDKFKDDPKKFRAEAPALIEDYMNKICKKYGFEPLGWSLHFDEGHKNGDSKELNVHAHIHMVNYDFQTNKARFREIQQKYVKKRKFPNPHFVAMQDLAGEVFAPLEFVRGISKTKTNKKHLVKEQHVLEKLEKREQELKEKDALIEEKTEDYRYISEQFEDLKKDYSELETDVSELKAEKSRAEENMKMQRKAYELSLRGLFDRFNEKLGALLTCFLKNDFNAVQERIEHVQKVIDTSYDDFDTGTDGSGSIGDGFVDLGNTVIEPHSGNKPFKKRKI